MGPATSIYFQGARENQDSQMKEQEWCMQIMDKRTLPLSRTSSLSTPLVCIFPLFNGNYEQHIRRHK